MNRTCPCLETEHMSIINQLKAKNKKQEKVIESFKEKEAGYKDKMYQLEKELHETKHQLELSKIEYDREIQVLKEKLDQNKKEVDKQFEDFVMNKLDLDRYNITSDDFRQSELDENANEGSRNTVLDKNKKQNVTRIHPLVPKLDFTKIFEWREKSNNDNVIMIRISESRITGEDQIKEEINDEKGVQKSNKKYFHKGSDLSTNSDRIQAMFERKKLIINALNQAYADEDDDTIMTPKGDESETDN